MSATPSAALDNFVAVRFHQRDQRVAIVLQLLVADAGDAAELVERRRAHAGDAVDRGIVQHHIGRHAVPSGDLRTPRPQRGLQRWIAGFALAGWLMGTLATPAAGSD